MAVAALFVVFVASWAVRSVWGNKLRLVRVSGGGALFGLLGQQLLMLVLL